MSIDEVHLTTRRVAARVPREPRAECGLGAAQALRLGEPPAPRRGRDLNIKAGRRKSTRLPGTPLRGFRASRTAADGNAANVGASLVICVSLGDRSLARPRLRRGVPGVPDR